MKITTIDQLDVDDIYYRLKELEKNGMPIIFKNRIALCEYLNIPSGHCGNLRISEDNYLSAIFKSHKDKHKIIITEIYDNYKDMVPSRIKYKELKCFYDEYKDDVYDMGVYGIYVDDKLVYIGSALNMYNRIREHCSHMYSNEDNFGEKYIHLHKYILNGSIISFKIIDKNITLDNRYNIEYQYIEKYKPELNTVGVTKKSPFEMHKEIKKQIKKYKNKIETLHQKINDLEKLLTHYI